MDRTPMPEPEPVLASIPGGSYFATPRVNATFTSGCAVLDCALGGGWGLNRIANIVGDKSTGKTLLAIEAMACYARLFPDHDIYYHESEAAFDASYAQAIGLPTSRLTPLPEEVAGPMFTVEDWFARMQAIISKGKPALVVLDSLDALSDKAELERDIGDGSFGAQKAKKLSELFRRLVQQLDKQHITVIVISQVRDNLAVSFGNKHTRSGGKALDFYCSQIIWLAHLKQIKKTKNKVERFVGVQIKAKVSKNKIGVPLRECEFPIIFGYGIDSTIASLEWLAEVGRQDVLGYESPAVIAKVVNSLDKLSDAEFATLSKDADAAVRKLWWEIEEGFLPTRKKY